MDQNIGASPKQRLLEEACFAETMLTAGGQTVTLAIVAYAEIYSGQDQRCAGIRIKSHHRAGTLSNQTAELVTTDGSTDGGASTC
jgi:hypothetical protein